jgi:hypothetical protein
LTSHHTVPIHGLHNAFFNEQGWLRHSGTCAGDMRIELPDSEGEWVCMLTFLTLHQSVHSMHETGGGPIPGKMLLVTGRGQPIGVLRMQSHGSKSAAHPGISVCCSLLLDGGNHMSGGVSGCGNLDQYIDSRETSSTSVTMKVVIITMYV